MSWSRALLLYRDPAGRPAAVATGGALAGLLLLRGPREALLRHESHLGGRGSGATGLLSRAVGFHLFTACGCPDAAAAALRGNRL